ncbi:uncharacterized protein LOC105661822 isoform X1 [Megachile rotundata]|uniref:uncharacterized protein LOC105661822 isoform X1 n=1 Tax=Megachile rotundata TaxID=143995 RepID=UPI003FCFFF6B
MTNSCRLFTTEYRRNFVKHKLKPVDKIIQGGGFEERIEEGQIDPRIASIPSQLDDAAEQLVYNHRLDYLRSVYQVTFTNPWLPRSKRHIAKEKPEEKDFENELVAYIHDLYFDPHNEKVLAPPVTTKRVLGYMRPLLLHGGLSMYQDTFGRTGAKIILQEDDKKRSKLKTETSKHNNTESSKVDPCNTQNYEN